MNEQFIFDELVIRSESAIQEARRIWAVKGRVSSSILIWPADNVRLDNGAYYSDVISGTLPEKRESRPTFFTKIIERLNPYAILVVERDGDQIIVVLESVSGVRSWVLPIERHGDAEVLGKTQAGSSKLGLLYRINQPAA